MDDLLKKVEGIIKKAHTNVYLDETRRYTIAQAIIPLIKDECLKAREDEIQILNRKWKTCSFYSAFTERLAEVRAQRKDRGDG